MSQFSPDELESQNETYHRDLLSILEKANQIASSTGLDELLEQMLDLIIEVTGSDAGTLYLVDHETDELVFKVVKGDENSKKLVGKRMNINQGIVGATIQERKPIVVEDLKNDPRWYRPPDQVELKSVVSVPLLSEDKPIGAVQVFNCAQYELELIQILGNRMASEVDKAVLLEASEERSKRLQALINIIGNIGSTLDQDQLLRLIVNHAKQLLNTEASSLFLVEQETGDLIMHVSSNQDELSTEKIRVPAGKGIIGHVVATGEITCVNNTELDERHYGGVDEAVGFTTRSILAVPLRTRTIAIGRERGAYEKRIIGGLEAINKIDGTFNNNDVQLLETLARQAATVIQIAQAYADTNELFLDVIRVLSAAIDAKDPYTRGHSQRVSEFSVTIAQEMEMDPEFVHHLRIGATLHDVGKIGVSDLVLKKPGRLTEEEFDEMKRHPAIGQNIMQEVRMLRSELPALAEHHERLDGEGYPNQLSGDEISLMGRIVAVADVFDALTSDRPYRGALSVEEAFEILKEGIGSHFDLRPVEALINAYLQGKIKTQKERQMLDEQSDTHQESA